MISKLHDRKIEERILVVAPTGRDAELATTILGRDGYDAIQCEDIEEFCRYIEEGAGAALLTEEALNHKAVEVIVDCFRSQESWSDFPLLVLCSPERSKSISSPAEMLGPDANVSLLDRPIHLETFLKAVQSALRARRRQYETRDLMEALEDRVRERDQFLAILGHELRNPLSAILMAVETMDTDGNAEAEYRREMIHRQTRHLKRLVDDLLDVSRVTTGKIILQRERVDAADLVRRCCEALPDLHDGHNLEVAIQQEPLPIEGDPIRLEEILNNLLINAMKYTPAGGDIRVSARWEEADIVISVTDSGVGMEPDVVRNIFNLFSQADNTLDRSRGGLGLGLTLVKTLVELHGGSVEAWSEGPGRGTRMTVRIPASNSAVGTDRTRVDPEPRVASGMKPYRLVIVEDNPDVNELLKAMLRNLGHEVESAADGREGADLILQTCPDAAFIDIGLPGLNGFEVAAKLREEMGSSIFLVALTGYGQPEDRQKALQSGFDYHMTKPASVSELKRVLGRLAKAEPPHRAGIEPQAAG